MQRERAGRQPIEARRAEPHCDLLLAIGPIALIIFSSPAAENNQGAQLAAMCASCHRLDGLDKGIPSIIGLDENKLAGMMAEFKSDKRKSQIMGVVARSLSDEEVADARALSRDTTKGSGAAMNCWTRRQFGCLAGAACLTALAPRVARSQAKSRVVVIGGGIGGATVAKYLAASAGTIEVTLVEPKPRYTTCFFSNLYLAGMRSFELLTHGYEALAQTIRHQGHPRFRGGDRSGGKDRRAQERRQARLRPARACPGHRLQIRRHRGL